MDTWVNQARGLYGRCCKYRRDPGQDRNHFFIWYILMAGAVSIAEIRAKITGGIDINNVLGAMKSGTVSAKEATFLLKEAIKSAGKATTDASKLSEQAAKDELINIKLRKDAQNEASRTVIAAKREEAKAAREASAVATKAKREEAKATREATKETKEAIRAGREFGNTVKEIARGALDAGRHMSKLAEVRGFEEMKKRGDSLEVSIVRLRASMEMTVEEWDKLGGKNIIFDVAAKSGKTPLEVIEGLRQAQNETSSAKALLADNGAGLKTAAQFGQVTEATVGDTAVTNIKAAQMFKIPIEQAQRIPDLLYKQHIEGSLTGKQAQKFVGQYSQYMNLSGNKFKGDPEGALKSFGEFMALANIGKDRGGFGVGDSGAASTATAMGGFLKSMLKGKGFGTKDHSTRAILKEGLGHDVMDKAGFVDLPKMIEDLTALKGKMGDAKFGSFLTKAFRENKANRLINAWITGEEIDKGTGKSLRPLSMPNLDEGSVAWRRAHGELMQTTELQNKVLEGKEDNKILDKQGDTKDLFLDIRKYVGDFKAEHPMATMISENPVAQLFGLGLLGKGATKLGATTVLKKALPGLVQGIASVGIGTAALAGSAVFLPGDTAPLVEPEQQVKNLRKGAEEKRQGGLKGWFARTFTSGTAENNESEANRIEALLTQIANKPPATIVIQATGVEARTVAEAKPSAELAHSTGPQRTTAAPTPGRR